MKYILFSLLLAAALPVTSSFAQVTIGSAEPPVRGALLDLKTEADGSSTKGLGLPRVKLIKIADTDISVTIDGVAANAYTGDHTGLLVYNVVDPSQGICAPIPAGIYVWSGDQWQNLGQDSFGSVENYKDQEGNEFFARNFGMAGTWMIQNVRAKHYAKADGTADTDNPIPATVKEPINPLYNPSYSYPNPDENGTIPFGSVDFGVAPSTWSNEQGLLYNWAAATKSRGGDGSVNLGDEGQGGANEANAENVQGICPKGWHLPTDREWNKLEKELTEAASLYSTSTANSTWDSNWETVSNGQIRGTHGVVMKSQCPLSGSIYPSGGNSLTIRQGGFNALLLGQVDVAYPFHYGELAYFWSNSVHRDINPWHRALRYNEEGVQKDNPKLSIRNH